MKFDIFSINPVEVAPSCRSPALIAHGIDDDLISIDHMRRVFGAYSGEKVKVELEGGHNTIRPDTFVT
jgi:dipeptidyl aminopeptidase/acylaminoacyl peptidase